jgi:DNA polymerase III epsilon subunit-like protein
MVRKMVDLSNRPIVVVDLETSGVNPFRHEVLAVGLAPLDRGLPPLSVYVRPERIQWTEYAERNFERFSGEWNAESISPAEACVSIERYLAEVFSGKPVTPLGHNVGFDLAFLRKLAFLGGRDQLAGLSHRAIDTHTLLYMLASKGQIPHDAATSDGAFRHFGIAVDGRHTAIGDAIATRDLVYRLLELL